MEKELRELGLTGNETKVYLALLGLGSSNVGEIIKKAKIHRNIIYDNLERLIEKGLVSFVTIRNVKHFEVTSSKELKEFIKKQKEEILKKEKIAEKVIPRIEELRNSTLRKQEATIFRGKRGLKTILEEITEAKSEILVFGTGRGMKETMGTYYDQWHLKLRKNKVKAKILLPNNRKEAFLKPFIAKYLPEKNIIPSTIAIYEDKVLNIVWGEEPIAVLFVSKKCYESYEKYFKLLWELAKK